MIKFLTNIIKSKTTESSKRFIAVLTFLLVTYLVIRFGNKENIVELVIVLTGFISVLLGVAAFENIKNKNNDTN